MGGLLNHLGRLLGQNAVPALHHSRHLWASLTGEPAEAWKAEEKLGHRIAIELRAEQGLTRDAAAENVVGWICQRLAAELKDPVRSFSCEMLADSEPGAVALPGGYLFVTEGLFRFCGGNEAELAFLIGHEMGHVVLGHARDRLLNDAALKLVSLVSFRAGQVGQWYRQQGAARVRAANGQRQEFEADLFGADLAAVAGYDPMGPIDLLERLGRQRSHREAMISFFDSHPPLEKRLARLRFQPSDPPAPSA